MSSVIEAILPFNCVNFNDLSVLSHYFVSNGWIFKKLILNIYIYDNGLVMHVNVHQGVISYRGVIAF